MVDAADTNGSPGFRRARLGLHVNKALQMFSTWPALLFMIYLGLSVTEVLDSTLARMHLPGGASAGASTIASPFSLNSRGAASDAIDQWNQWSGRYTKATLSDLPNTGLPLGVVLTLYVLTDIFLITLPVFLIIKRLNRRASKRLKRFEDAKTLEKGDKDSTEQQVAAAKDALNRVSGLSGLLRMSFIATICFLVFDATEDAFLIAAGTTQNSLLIILTGVASLFKWVAFASALVGLVVGLIGSRGMRRDPVEGIQSAVRHVGNKWVYPLALRIQIGVGIFLLLFGALRGDLGHQLDDAFLFPFGRGGLVGYWTVAVAGVLLVSVLITSNLCLRAYLPRTEAAPVGDDASLPVKPKHKTTTNIWGCIIVGLLLSVYAVTAHTLAWPFGMALFAPGVLLLLIGIYSKFASGETKPDVFNTNEHLNLEIGWPYSIAISVIPLVVLTALAVRNGVRLLTIHQYRYGVVLILIFPFAAIALGAILVTATYAILHRTGRLADRERADATRRDGRPVAWSALVLGVLALVLFVVMGASPQHSGSLFGPWGAIFALCVFLVLSGTALVILSDQIRAWGVIAATGFRRTPFIAAIFLCLFANSAVDDRSVYHDVRLGADLNDHQYVGLMAGPPGPDYQIGLTQALDQWSELQRHSGAPRKEIPLVFVASAGGGIRAAYWTALVMRCLVTGSGGDACPHPVLPMDSIFLASGISGGSLGLAGIHGIPDGTDWLDTLRHDFLGPTIAAMAFRDLPNSLLRLNVHDSDRAAVLEEAWEIAAGGKGRGLDRGLLETAYNADGSIAFPMLVLNGTSVTDGCRVAATALSLSTATPEDGHTPSSATDCLALNQQRFAARGAALPTLPATKDVFDNTCTSPGDSRHDIRLSTAALLSARFPYVSPTGALHSCTGGERTFDLDGGLIDSSGALPLAMIWPEVVSWLNNQQDNVCFAPKLIIMENGYVDQTKSDPPAHPNEMAAPLAATMATQAAAAPTARQAAALAFQKSFASAGCDVATQSSSSAWTVPNVVDFYPVAQPGIEAPLGWTLSFYSQQSLEGQITSAANRCAANIVAAWFSGSTTEPDPCKEGRPQ